jgi:hypothetical protein
MAAHMPPPPHTHTYTPHHHHTHSTDILRQPVLREQATESQRRLSTISYPLAATARLHHSRHAMPTTTPIRQTSRASCGRASHAHSSLPSLPSLPALPALPARLSSCKHLDAAQHPAALYNLAPPPLAPPCTARSRSQPAEPGFEVPHCCCEDAQRPARCTQQRQQCLRLALAGTAARPLLAAAAAAAG